MELFKLFGTIAINNSDANKAIDDTAGKGEKAQSRLVSAFQKIGKAVVAYFATSKIIDFGKEVVRVAAEVSAEASAFEQIMGEYSEEAAKKVQKIADATGIVDTRLKPYMTSMTAKFKGLGYDIDDATGYASRGLNLAADAAAFWDKSLDDSMSHLNSFVNGSYQGGEAIGLFANDTQMAAFAIEQGLIKDKKAWTNLDEATKQATRLEYAEAMFAMSGVTGQAAKEAEQYANVQANLTEKWRQFKAQIGEPLLQNVVIPAMKKLADAVDWVSRKFEDLKIVAGNVGEFWREVLKPAIDTVWEAIKNVYSAIKTAIQPFLDLASGIGGNIQPMQIFREICWKIEDVLIKLSEKLNAFSDWAREHPSLLKTIVAAITGVVAALTAYKAVTLAITAAQKAQIIITKGVAAAQALLNAAMSLNPIGLIIAAITALVAAFVYLWNNCEGFRNFWINLWEKIKDVAGKVAKWFKQAWNDVVEWFTGAWEKIKAAASAVWEGIKTVWQVAKAWFKALVIDPVINLFTGLWNALKTIWDTIVNVVSFAVQLIASILDAAFQIITLPFRFIWENCKEYVFAAWEWIKEKVSSAIESVKNTIVKVWTAVSSFFSTVWNGIKTVVGAVWDWIKARITARINAVKLVVITVFNAVKSFVTTVWNGIKTIVGAVWDWLKEKVTERINAIKTVVTTVFSVVKSVVSTVWNGIKSVITSVWDNIKSNVTNSVNNIKNTVSNVFNAVKSVVSSVWNGIKTTISNTIDGAKNTVKAGVDAIKGFFEKLTLKLPKIKLPHFKLTGSFSLSPPSVPKLSVEWYKKAYDAAAMFTSPTIVPTLNGYKGFGDGNGAEFVTGQQNLEETVRSAVRRESGEMTRQLDKLIGVILQYLPELLANSKKEIRLDSGVLVGELAGGFDVLLGDINRLKLRGQ